MAPPHLKWKKGAKAVFRNRPWPSWEAAARVDKAVIDFATMGGGEGELVAVSGDPKGFRLLVPPYEVRLEIDEEKGTIMVLDVHTIGWERR